MCRSAYDNLVAGGRFVAYTVNPAFTLSQPNSTKYRVTMLRQTPAEDRYLCDMEFVTDPPTPYQHPQWSQDAHEWAIQEAGFRTFAWHPSEVSPADVARYGVLYPTPQKGIFQKLAGWNSWRDDPDPETKMIACHWNFRILLYKGTNISRDDDSAQKVSLTRLSDFRVLFDVSSWDSQIIS
jgi:hypothetical protein